MNSRKRSQRHRRYNKRHARRQLKHSLTYKKWRRRTNRAAQGRPRPKNIRSTRPSGYREVHVPNTFSVLQNPDGCFALIDKLDQLRRGKRKAFVILRDVVEIDYGAVVLLLCAMLRFRTASIAFNGDHPRNAKAKALLRASGFFDYLYRQVADQERYEIATDRRGRIVTHGGKLVESRLSSQVIQTASTAIWGSGRRCQGVQRVLVELMHNTNNHANPILKGDKHWWLSVHNDPMRHCSVFSFVDFGVGVTKSLHQKNPTDKWYGWAEKLRRRFKYRDNVELLRLILDGSLHSVVGGDRYRGKGLPGIAEALGRNQISNLHVITNDVFFDVAAGEGRKLTTPFEGTFVSWELRRSNVNCT